MDNHENNTGYWFEDNAMADVYLYFPKNVSEKTKNENNNNENASHEKGNTLKVSRAILSDRSPIFQKQFMGYEAEDQHHENSIYVIENHEYEIFADLILYLYCGYVELRSVQQAQKLLKAAEQYEVLDLINKCLEYIEITSAA